jgi:CheY-like chemotaxis protein
MGTKTRTESAPRRVRASQSLRGRRLLVVDDDRAFTDAVARWARREGARVAVARHGAEALRRLRASRYDALLVDLRMPEMDGYELHLRLAIERPETLGRVLLVTGDAANPDARAFLARSGSPYLEKPFDLDELREALLALWTRA